MTSLDVFEASLSDKPVLRQLLQLYLYDFSEIDGRDLDEHGVYGYRFLDHYWTETGRHPFLFRCEGQWSGFALIRAGEPNSVAEFFVLRKYRRLGVGARAGQHLFARFPGNWMVEQVAGNPGA